MKYSINTDSNNKILAVNRWKDNIIPNGLEEITETQYNDLLSRDDLPYITWTHSNIVDEPTADKVDRLNNQNTTLQAQKLEEIKLHLIEVQDYVTLTQDGIDLINS